MLLLPLKVPIRYDVSSVLAKWLDQDDDGGSNCDQAFHTLPSSTNQDRSRKEGQLPGMLVPPKPNYKSHQCYKELQRLQSVRNCIADCILQSNSHAVAMDENALRDCYEYHAILLEFEQRGFPVVEMATHSKNNNDDGSSSGTQLSIPWKGAYSTVQKESHTTLLWDRVCIMYNIVALLTHQIQLCSTTDRESCKLAVGYCQQGASLLSILRELCSSISTSGSNHNATGSNSAFITVDLSSSMLLFWEKLLLAEAQCFIYRMASLSESTDASSDTATIGRQHRTLAVLCQSSHELYNDALNASQDPRLISEIPKQVTLWGSYIKAASMLYIGRATYHQSVVYQMNCEYGNEIAQLRDCQSKLQQCADFIHSTLKSDPNNENAPTATAVDYTFRECNAIVPIVIDRLHEADRTNLQLYHDVIPKTVPSIPAKQLAKINPELPNQMIIPQIPLFIDL
jgi:BRO1-like domain